MSTVKFDIGYVSSKSLNLKCLEEQFSPTPHDLAHDFNPFSLNAFQYSQPIHNLFFKEGDVNFDSIQLNSKYHMVDMNTVSESGSGVISRKPVFIKYSPLLDPVRYMIGKYDTQNDEIRTLPKNGEGFSKLSAVNNASYTDGFFSFLTSKLLYAHNIKHSIDYYGSYLAVQRKFKMNIADDFEYLNDSDFFNENINKLFHITQQSSCDLPSENSRSNKEKLTISDEVNINDIILIETDGMVLTTENKLIEEVFQKNSVDEESGSSDEESGSSDEESGSSDEESGSSDEESSDEDEESSDEDEHSNEDCNENEIYAYVDNFPVNMICLEKCNGTMDQLFVDNEIDEEIGASALFQIAMTLIAFDKAFKFTHNDLHTNNIMYVNTDADYLFYKFEGKRYKVPTYGKIFKIIDFGRSIYKFKGNLFCSDSFDVGGDAATQYNFPPFFNKKRPIIEPNPSFDLCRLGCSIYDFVISGRNPADELQKTIARWCSDDKGASVLYKKNGDERYPEFKLYKMIARNVHKHTPKAQLEFPFFKQFLVTDELSGCDLMDLDTVPDYST